MNGSAHEYSRKMPFLSMVALPVALHVYFGIYYFSYMLLQNDEKRVNLQTN